MNVIPSGRSKAHRQVRGAKKRHCLQSRPRRKRRLAPVIPTCCYHQTQPTLQPPGRRIPHKPAIARSSGFTCNAVCLMIPSRCFAVPCSITPDKMSVTMVGSRRRDHSFCNPANCRQYVRMPSTKWSDNLGSTLCRHAKWYMPRRCQRRALGCAECERMDKPWGSWQAKRL